jgi:uncharacterized protein YkwD
MANCKSTSLACLIVCTLLVRFVDAAEQINRKQIRLSNLEHRLVSAVNAHRARHNLEPLSVDPTLMHVARQSAPHFSHQVNGKWCWHRCRDAGFSGWATDDIANGYLTPEDAVQGWATSHGHAMQMRGYFKMNGRWQNYRFNRIGVGISGRKYIAIFGRANERRPTASSHSVARPASPR